MTVPDEHPFMPSAEPAAPKLVVFDFDGTLVRGDSFARLNARMCLDNPARVLASLAVVPFVLLALPLRRTRALGVSLFFWAATAGLPARDVVRRCRSYARSDLPARAIQPALDALQRHLACGDRVLVVTASLPAIVRAYLLAHGLPPVSVVGSSLRRCLSGYVARLHCIGRRKVGELERRFGLVAWHTVYTDSLLDLPLARAAQRVVVVMPRGSHHDEKLARWRSRLPPTIELAALEHEP